MEFYNKKSEIRRSVLEARGLLSEKDVQLKSSRIIEKLFEMECFQNSGLIMCYMDFRNEVMTGNLIRKSMEIGKKIALPCVNCNTIGKKEMVASMVENIETDLERGTYGILEPKREKIRIVDPKKIDLCIVPGVVFDLKKNRIGYGAGYYDRFLKCVRRDCQKVGIAFEMQVVESIPADENDVALDFIITDKRII